VNNPPTAVGGICRGELALFCRKDVNNPPTAVGGICRGELALFCRKDLNNPPTAVGGILGYLSADRTRQIWTLPVVLALLDFVAGT